MNHALIPGNGTDAYTFTANPGDSYTFSNVFNTLPNARWRLIDKYNHVIFETSLSTNESNISLTAGGTYSLLVEGRIFDTAASGSYSFTANFLGTRRSSRSPERR